METPAAPAEFPDLPASAALGPVPVSLLIVEDNASERAYLAALARHLGVAVVYEAGNGREALRLLEHLGAPPAVAMLDLEMPEMDGIELIEQLHARGARIPMLLVSGRDAGLVQSVGTMAEQLGLPLLGVLGKPVAAAVLHAALCRRHPEVTPTPAFVPFLKAPAAKGPTRSELAQAIAAGQIAVHYQPKVDFANGQPVGVEALARWTHPELGEVPPDKFIPLAEREGLIHSLTLSVLDQAMQQAAAWNAEGIRLSLAANLSPRLLASAELVDEIVQLQQRHRVSPAQVVLELTESASANQFGAALGVLTRLRLKGFGLSIDDYGTGFSSMQQLAKIPFTELKFDRSFVQGATRRENHRVILQSSLQMSRRLGLVTVAEGIETAAEWQLLKSFGCVLGQGWFIARPMPADALPGWLAAHRGRVSTLQARPPAPPPPPSPTPSRGAAPHAA